ncbi:23S rRNA (uridine(2552)-2'-O)-methyltransferase [Haloplanus halobius]|uniref:23S rRNA (uridine(2552)-2'-O)-methyltransferase n=1 Tax=Haloplanus halobius TaxID=2934938 RepID=UPI0020107973|nr:23S rRNA (uridine(2552)-2'-O)-methyltransferase [Haloplanus sp. XH21]
MTGKDEYYNKAKQEGYRARSAYKLQQLDETATLFDTGDVVVDLGAAPGGWLQVAAEAVGPSGTVVGVDFQRIDPLDSDAVETVRGDMTDEETVDRLRETIGKTDVDIVLSDMAPNMTGEYSVDHARSVYLARQASTVATDVLAPGGDLVVKVFEGPDLADLRAEMEESFEYVRAIHPDASRDSSSELYLVARGYLTAPVSEGDELTVEIVDQGSEGDGIADVDGFTIFVPGADVGDTVDIRIDDIKPRFGFAERLD